MGRLCADIPCSLVLNSLGVVMSSCMPYLCFRVRVGVWTGDVEPGIVKRRYVTISFKRPVCQHIRENLVVTVLLRLRRSKLGLGRVCARYSDAVFLLTSQRDDP